MQDLSDSIDKHGQRLNADESMKMMKELSKTIQFHADVQQLSFTTTKIWFSILFMAFYIFRMAYNFSDQFNDHIMVYLLFQVARSTGCLFEIHLVRYTSIDPKIESIESNQRLNK